MHWVFPSQVLEKGNGSLSSPLLALVLKMVGGKQRVGGSLEVKSYLQETHVWPFQSIKNHLTYKVPLLDNHKGQQEKNSAYCNTHMSTILQ